MFRLKSKEKEINIEMDSRTLYVPQPEVEEEKTLPLSSSLIETRLASSYNILAKILQNQYSFTFLQAPLITRSIAQYYSHKESLNRLLVIGGFLSKESDLYKTFLTSPLFDSQLIKTNTSPFLEDADKTYGYLRIKYITYANWKKAAEDWLLKNDCGEAFIVIRSSHYKLAFLYTFGECEELTLKENVFEIIQNKLSTEHSILSWIDKESSARGALCSADDFREIQIRIARRYLIDSLVHLKKSLPKISDSNKRLIEHLMQITELGEIVAKDITLNICKSLSPCDYDYSDENKVVRLSIIVLRSIAICYGYHLPEAKILLNSVENKISDTQQLEAIKRRSK